MEKEITKNCVRWIQNWFDENGPDCKAVIGISGGKDSSIVAALCVEALGKDRVLGVLMPQGEQKDIVDSIRLCNFLNIDYVTVNIKSTIDTLLNEISKPNSLRLSDQTLTNLPARIRMSTLYAVSQTVNGRVSRNCNYSEIYVGYSTRWGDDAGDFAPLAGLLVSEVIELGLDLGLPHNLIFKTPVDGLNVNTDGSYVTDEQAMGFTYNELEEYLQGKEISKYSKDKIEYLHKKNGFKSLPIPFFKK